MGYGYLELQRVRPPILALDKGRTHSWTVKGEIRKFHEKSGSECVYTTSHKSIYELPKETSSDLKRHVERGKVL